MNRSEFRPVAPAATFLDIFCAGRLRRFHLFDTLIGRTVSVDVLRGESYPLIPFLTNVRTVLDVGANVGAASVYLALHYPEARVFAFEPDPRCWALLRQNVADLTGVEVFGFGLSDCNGRAELFPGTEDPATNSLHRSVLASGEGLAVELRSPEPLLADLGVGPIDILKLDAEGSEVEILRAMAARLPATGAVYVEYHDEADRRAIDRLLESTHTMYRGSIHAPHRGELCYVLTSSIPEEASRLRVSQR